MLFQILLLSVIVVTAYLGPMILRRGGPEQRLYGFMLVIDTAVAIAAFLAARSDGSASTANLLGVVAIGGGICLVMVPPVLRDLGRRARVAGHLRLARLLAELREHLQPGMGARAESELIDAVIDVHAGRVDRAISALRQRRAELEDPLARRRVDERIVMTFLYARRWSDAIEQFEATFEVPRAGVPPHLLVEMVRAYCEDGRLDRAAALMERLEASPLAEEPMLAALVNRARLIFLAYVGRTTAVEAIVAPGGPLGSMPEAARRFWAGVARLKAGDRSGARSSLAEAARLSGRDERARELAEEVMSGIDLPGVAGPHAMPAPVAELADRLAARGTRPHAERERSAPRLSGVAWRTVPVTLVLIALNLAVAVAMAAVFGSTGDLAGLVRAGANLKSAVGVGEWWRLPASMFLHIGVLHLTLNMYGLWVLGRLVEQIFGSVRFAAIYMLAGVGGSLSSYLFGGPGTSAGASGAVFGLLGAAIAALALHRKAYPERWRSARCSATCCSSPPPTSASASSIRPSTSRPTSAAWSSAPSWPRRSARAGPSPAACRCESGRGCWPPPAPPPPSTPAGAWPPPATPTPSPATRASSAAWAACWSTRPRPGCRSPPSSCSTPVSPSASPSRGRPRGPPLTRPSTPPPTSRCATSRPGSASATSSARGRRRSACPSPGRAASTSSTSTASPAPSPTASSPSAAPTAPARLSAASTCRPRWSTT